MPDTPDNLNEQTKPTRVLFAVADPRGGEEHYFPEMFRANAGKLPDYIEVDGRRYLPKRFPQFEDHKPNMVMYDDEAQRVIIEYRKRLSVYCIEVTPHGWEYTVFVSGKVAHTFEAEWPTAKRAMADPHGTYRDAIKAVVDLVLAGRVTATATPGWEQEWARAMARLCYIAETEQKPAPAPHGHASVEDWLAREYGIRFQWRGNTVYVVKDGIYLSPLGFLAERPASPFPDYPAARDAAVAWAEAKEQEQQDAK